MNQTETGMTRRGFLGAGGAVALGALLAACSSGSSSGGGSGTVTVLLPGTAAPGWQSVLDAVNKKLKSDLGLRLDTQYISWANYGNQALLKFTAGASFATALEARWLNMTQLVSDKALIELSPFLSDGKYSHLTQMIDPKTIQSNRWDGKLWGIPQVNSAARIQHFAIRQDLAEKYGLGTISGYDALERYWYDVKQKDSGMIPIALNSNGVGLTVANGQVPLFNADQWETPAPVNQAFSGDSLFFAIAADAATTKSSKPVPFWEAPGAMDALRRVRKYYQDEILNRDALNVDTSTEQAYFTSGKSATTWAITDGTSSHFLPALQKAVKGAAMANVVPLAGGLSTKIPQTFEADNFVVLNAKAGNGETAIKLQDWLSIKENHDLLSYGIEGKDWKQVGADEFEQVSQYTFPGFALCWRQALERLASYTTDSEKTIYKWAQDYNNFATDPLAGFIPDLTPVKSENAQMVSVVTQYAKPLFAGAVDVDSGLSKLKSACDGAGLDKLQAELARQADAFLKSR